jgi:hypothetical protein
MTNEGKVVAGRSGRRVRRGQHRRPSCGSGGESAAWNTRDFTLQVSTDGVTWATVEQMTGNTDSVTLHDVTAAGRDVRLNVITPTSNGKYRGPQSTKWRVYAEP